MIFLQLFSDRPDVCCTATSLPPGRRVVIRLTRIFRQAAASRIIASAHSVNRGAMPNLQAGEGSDFYFVERAEPPEVAATIVKVVAERIPLRFGCDPMSNVQVLSPMHRGEVGAQASTARSRSASTRPRRRRRARARQPRPARRRQGHAGQERLQPRRLNGDLGRIAAIEGAAEPRASSSRSTAARSPTSAGPRPARPRVRHQRAQVPGLRVPGRHRPVVTQHYLLLQRNLLYTALTRGKRLVVLVGTKKALGIAVRADDTAQRWTWLAERIRQAPR